MAGVILCGMYFFRSRNAFGDKTFPDAKRRERREGKKAQKDGAQVSCSSFDGEGHIHAGRHGRCIYEQDNIFFFTFCRGCLVEFTAARGRAAVHVMQDAAGVHVMDALAGGCRLGDFKSVPLGVGAKRPLAHSKHTVANKNSMKFVAALVENSSNAIKHGAYICFPFLKPARQPTREKQAPAQASV